MTRPLAVICFCLLSCLATGQGASAADDPGRGESSAGDPASGQEPMQGPAFSCGDGCLGHFFPAGSPYPPHLADPHRPGFGVEHLSYTRTAIPDASPERLNVKVGGIFGLAGISSSEQSDRLLQLGFIGAYDGLYDIRKQLDSIGWDGDYGLELSGRWSRALGGMLSLHHRSSHLGDEYIQRTGRKRIGYTREEIAGGVSVAPFEGWHLYAETGWGAWLGNRSVMKPWRLEGGVEYQSPQKYLGNRVGYYAAFDTTSMEERDWRGDLSLQAGLYMRSFGRLWRLGGGFYHGRPTVGEFFTATEEYLNVGFWMEW
ncbi:DUF1207 domain-containing protein [Geomonas sp. Red276]